jgi:YVTN family beta-propeller protein
MGKILRDYGFPNMSSAVRPMALSPDERFLYFQVSFFHGFVEYDLVEDRVTRVAHLPVPEEVRKLRRDEYILDSAHHGLAMNGAGTKLCVAGTMSNYAAIVSRESFRYRIHPLGARTYWATTSADGNYCYVSVAGDDSMSIISYDTEQEVARVPVGDHPQRARTARVATSIYGSAPASRVRARVLSLRARRAAARRIRLSGRLGFPASLPSDLACRGSVRLELRRGTRLVAAGTARLRHGSTGCGFTRTLAVPRGRLLARASFAGNTVLLARRSVRVAT